MLLIVIWKGWTGLALVGAAAGLWSWSWGLAFFFAPEVIFLVLMLQASLAGRRERKRAGE
jgi:hypothetical protein